MIRHRYRPRGRGDRPGRRPGLASPRGDRLQASNSELGRRAEAALLTLYALDSRLRRTELGTRMYVLGYGEGVAADAGGGVTGWMIDLWVASCAEADAWGQRTLTIYD